MATLTERFGNLELRVQTLETWAGPGQIDALLAGQRAMRKELTALRGQLTRVERVQIQHTAAITGLGARVADLTSRVTGLEADVATLKADVATLKADVATLKADMADVKSILSEVLRRLPEPGRG